MDKEKTPFCKQDWEYLLSDDGLIRQYRSIEKQLREYMDLDERYYSIVAVWIIGTYFHKQFSSYPYLYFNAMKGSGKTRLLKIISNLAKNGELVGSMTEAVLFRTAGSKTLCMDEAENINAKGKENIALLLNSAYKKGMKVKRMRKKHTVEGEQQVVEEFEVYCPIALANIWGMDSVLADRCVSLILERSNRQAITKLVEDFEDNDEFVKIRGGMVRLTEKIVPELRLFADLFKSWNIYQKNVVNKVNIVKDVSNVSIVSKIDDIDNIDDTYSIFKNIDESNLSGRDLELFFPLFIIADMIDRKIALKLIETAKELVELRQENDRAENRDVQLIEFLATSDNVNLHNVVNVSDIVSAFKNYLGEDDGEFVTSRGLSRSLNRLGLIKERKSSGKARQVKLDIEKAKEKLKLFKVFDNKPKSIKEYPEPKNKAQAEILEKIKTISGVPYTKEQIKEILIHDYQESDINPMLEALA